MTPSGKAEDRFIQRYFAPLASSSEAFGLHDDAAQITVPSGNSLVISTDTIVSGIHFFAEDPPASIARKALRVNISDLIAKGSKPNGYFLSLSLPKACLISDDWMTQFAAGLAQDQRQLGIHVLGGDTVMTTAASVINICAIGFVPEGQMVQRSGAKIGDRVYVTGTIGDSAIGLLVRKERLSKQAELNSMERQVLGCLTQQDRDLLELSYLEPPINLAAVDALLKFASASMDISDGLSGDAETLASASRVGLEIHLANIPHHAALQSHLDQVGLRNRMVTGGDDYQVLCTIPLEACAAFEADLANAHIDVSCIGSVVKAPGVRFFDESGNVLPLDEHSYDHFS